MDNKQYTNVDELTAEAIENTEDGDVNFDYTELADIVEIASTKGPNLITASNTTPDYFELQKGDNQVLAKGVFKTRVNYDPVGQIILSDIIIEIPDDVSECKDSIAEFADMSFGGGGTQSLHDDELHLVGHFD
jgi:hypothetical protein